MPRRVALRDEAFARTQAKPTIKADWHATYLYATIFEALEKRLRQAIHRGAMRKGMGELEWWEMARRVANDKVRELRKELDGPAE